MCFAGCRILTKGRTDALRDRHIEDARELVLVLRFCVEKRVPLLFG
ncbi:hypothetical protein ACQKM2_40545 [Streptomyces sp. NPDC004126]